MSKPGSFLKRERCGWECRGPVFMGHGGSLGAGHGHPYCPAECGDGLHGKRTDCGVAHDATRGAAGISVRGPSLSGRTVVKCGVCHLETTLHRLGLVYRGMDVRGRRRRLRLGSRLLTQMAQTAASACSAAGQGLQGGLGSTTEDPRVTCTRCAGRCQPLQKSTGTNRNRGRSQREERG